MTNKTLWDRYYCMTKEQNSSKGSKKPTGAFRSLAYLVWLPTGTEPSNELFAKAGRLIGHEVAKGTNFYWSLTKKEEGGDWITRMKSAIRS